MTLHHHHRHLFANRQATLIRLPAAEPTDRAGQDAIDSAVHTVLGDPELDLIGMCCDLGMPSLPDTVAAQVEQSIAHMDDIRRAHGLISTTLVLDYESDPGGGDAREQRRLLRAAVDAGLDSACEKYQFPRPALTLMLRTATPTADPTPAPASAAAEPLTPLPAWPEFA